MRYDNDTDIYITNQIHCELGLHGSVTRLNQTTITEQVFISVMILTLTSSVMFVATPIHDRLSYLTKPIRILQTISS